MGGGVRCLGTWSRPDVNDQREGGIGQIGSSRSISLALFPLSCPSLSFVRLLVSCQSGTQTQLKLSPETGIASLIRNPHGSVPFVLSRYRHNQAQYSRMKQEQAGFGGHVAFGKWMGQDRN